MIFDLIVVLIFIGLILLGVFRGAAKSLSRLIASVISYLAATAIGQWLSLWAYDVFAKPTIEKCVTEAVNNVSGETAENIVSALPSWLTGISGLKAEDITNAFSDPLSSATDTIIDAVKVSVKPVICGLLAFFFTILIYLLFAFILQKVLVKPLVALFKFPVLNVINRVAGGVIGFVDALLVVCMAAYLIKLILGNCAINSTWFNVETINKSFIFRQFYSGNIFTWIGSLIAGNK